MAGPQLSSEYDISYQKYPAPGFCSSDLEAVLSVGPVPPSGYPEKVTEAFLIDPVFEPTKSAVQ